MKRPHDEVWFVIPSASVEKCRATLPLWRQQGYKIAVLQNHQRGDIPADVVVWADSYPGWPGSVNRLCREVVPKQCKLIVTGGDDMRPDPHRPAEQLLREFLERFPDTFGVMQPHGDEFLGAKLYCGSPFVGRAFFETMYQGAGVMPECYRHNWADNELFWVASGLGVLWSRPDVSHFHDHFTRQAGAAAAMPDYWKSNVKPHELLDCLTFIKRKARGFPGHEPAGGVPMGPGANAGRRATLDRSILRDGQSCPAEWHLTHPPAVTSDADPAAHWSANLAAALADCQRRGLEPVAIYGSGTHTRHCGPALATPAARVACIIDDDPSRHGQTLWGWPIVSQEGALKLGVRAVVLSSNTFEDQLWTRAAPLRQRGVEVIRLYHAPQPATPAAPATTPANASASVPPTATTAPTALAAASA